MKAGELRKAVQGFTAFFAGSWICVGSEFMRRDADWVQIVTLNPARFADKYVPRSCLEFLKMPGPPTGSFLVRELHHPSGSQRWVKVSEAPSQIFGEMIRQFSPPLLDALAPNAVERLLEQELGYWPHAYALCVIAAERGDAVRADQYRARFEAAVADRPYPWVQQRQEELDSCLQQLGTSQLAERLRSLAEEKLKALRLPL